MTLAVRTLLDLVSIPSSSALSNRPVIEYALGCLNPAHWKIEQFSYRDDFGAEKVNLLAVANSHDPQDIELALVCHTDTVPFDAEWREGVHPQVRNGNLYGRGSCDVKGFLACILASVARIDPSSLTKGLAIVLTADEEIGCIGAKHLAQNGAWHSRYTIIGEPTDLQPVRAGKGYALAEIRVQGREAHSAFPSQGHSAIYDAARVVAALERVEKELAGRENRDFDPPYTTLNIGMIQGGRAKNIIAGECRIVVEWRPVPGEDPSYAAVLIRQEIAALEKQFPELKASLEVKRVDPPFAPTMSPTLATLLELLTSKPATTVSFGTEAAHLSPLTTETVVFGPGSMTTAHKTGEYVPVAELEQCVDYLTTIIQRICG